MLNPKTNKMPSFKKIEKYLQELSPIVFMIVKLIKYAHIIAFINPGDAHAHFIVRDFFRSGGAWLH